MSARSSPCAATRGTTTWPRSTRPRATRFGARCGAPQAIGELSIEIGPPTEDAIEEFIRLHTERFGEHGLFPDNEGGRRSLRFIRRLAELERAEPDGGVMHVARVRCGGRLVYILVAFDDGQSIYMYNGGIDPGAVNTSPGVTGAAMYFQDRIAAGRRRFDFLRGQERYKYEWGAVDEPIYRVLVERPLSGRGCSVIRVDGMERIVVTELMASGAGRRGAGARSEPRGASRSGPV